MNDIVEVGGVKYVKMPEIKKDTCRGCAAFVKEDISLCRRFSDCADVIFKRLDEEVKETCKWVCHDDVNMPNTWDGSCGVSWSIIEGTPQDNDMNFCPKCGKTLAVEVHDE